MYPLAASFPDIGPNTINAPALTLFGIVISGLVGIIIELIRTRARVDKVNNKVEPISNGFSASVEQKLDALQKSVDTMNGRLNSHIEWHVTRKD